MALSDLYEITTFCGLIVMIPYKFSQKLKRTLYPKLPYLLSRKSNKLKSFSPTRIHFHLRLLHLVKSCQGKRKLKCEFKMDLVWRFVGPRCLVCSYYNLHQQVKSHKAKCFNLPQSWENFMPIYLLHRAMFCLFALLI